MQYIALLSVVCLFCLKAGRGSITDVVIKMRRLAFMVHWLNGEMGCKSAICVIGQLVETCGIQFVGHISR